MIGDFNRRRACSMVDVGRHVVFNATHCNVHTLFVFVFVVGRSYLMYQKAAGFGKEHFIGW